MVGALLTDKLTAPGVPISHPRGGESKAQQDAPVQKKLLICAPSNAAVDELVTRLKQGVKTLKGEFHKINVIRLGRSDAINSNVKDVTLDELVRAKMEGDGKTGSIVLSEREKLHQQAARLKEAVDALRPKLEEARNSGNAELERRLQRDFDGKKRDQARIGARIEDDKASGNTASRENEITRRRLQQEIIDSAHVLCATLSGSGHEMFKNLSVEFETVIIDEAAQCIELSALIPLKYGCSKCILVGDPKQLPPTVLSKSAARYGYEQSLFVRMQQNHPNDVHLLDVQYRLHPEISKFPSKQFYDGRLIDGEGLAKLRNMPWHKSELLGPYRFFDVKGTQMNGAKGHSYVNMEEVGDALRLYNRLRSDYRSCDFRGKIGIITPYKAQLKELRQAFQRSCGEKVFDEIEFNTTDAFQGRESEIIIFSCVRARASGGIGFLEDIRRMNVGLTRAKSSLWILGDSRSLMQGEFWARLIEDAKARHLYSEGIMGQGTILTQPDAALRSAEGSRRNSSDTGGPKSIASVDMADIPAGRCNFIASVEMADNLDEPEDSIMSDSSDSRASSIAYSASRASSVAYPSGSTKSSNATKYPPQLASKQRLRKGKDEEERVKQKAEECAAEQQEEEYLARVSNPQRDSQEVDFASVANEAFEETWFDGTTMWRLVERGVYKKDGAEVPSVPGIGLEGTCKICGSNEHFAKECGNIAYLGHVNRLCGRCRRPPYHDSSNCTVPRCLECGKLGHREADCKGPKKSIAARKDIIKREEAFERMRQPLPQAYSGTFGAGATAYDDQTGFKKSSKHARAVSPTEEDGPGAMEVR
jgi:senataxin